MLAASLLSLGPGGINDINKKISKGFACGTPHPNTRKNTLAAKPRQTETFFLSRKNPGACHRRCVGVIYSHAKS